MSLPTRKEEYNAEDLAANNPARADRGFNNE